MKTYQRRVMAAVAGALLLTAPVAASAAPLPNLAPSFSAASDSGLQPAAFRRYPRFHHFGRGFGGAGIGLGLGLLGGAIIGGALADDYYGDYGGYYGGDQYYGGSIDDCASRFRSYDPGSRTYLGYDGRRHYCG